MSGTPLTKPLHNDRVQTGTGVSCMESRWGSTEFTAVRPLPWPLGFAVGVGAFSVISGGVPWLPSQPKGLIAQGLNQGISAALAPIVWMVLGICIAELVSLMGHPQRRKLLDTSTTLESPVANGWRQLEPVMCQSFRRQGYTVEEPGLGCASPILYKHGSGTLVQCKHWRNFHK